MRYLPIWQKMTNWQKTPNRRQLPNSAENAELAETAESAEIADVRQKLPSTKKSVFLYRLQFFRDWQKLPKIRSWQNLPILSIFVETKKSVSALFAKIPQNREIDFQHFLPIFPQFSKSAEITNFRPSQTHPKPT